MNDITFSPAVSPTTDMKQKHSKIGIASFVVSVLGVLIYCVAMLISFGYGISIGLSDPSAAQNPYQAVNYTAPIVLFAGLLSWCGPLLSFAGIGLGIPAVIQKNDKKIFGIVGLVISGLVLLVFCLMTVLGIAGRLASS